MINPKRKMNPIDEACHRYKIFPAYGFDGVYVSKEDGYSYTLVKELIELENPFRKIKPYKVMKDHTPLYLLMNIHNKTVEILGDRLCAQTFHGPFLGKVVRRFSDFDLNNGSDFKYEVSHQPIRISDSIILVEGIEFKRITCIKNTTSEFYVSKDGCVYSNAQHEFGFIKAHAFQHNLYHRIQFTYGDTNFRGTQYYALHRLVYETWNDTKIPEGIQINHIDGRKWHNSLDNLETNTSLENLHHAMKHNLREAPYDEDDIRRICGYIQQGDISPREIAKRMNRPYNSIRCMIKGLTRKGAWPHITKGYDFTKYRELYHRFDIHPNQIHRLCQMWESQKYTRQEISDTLGIPKTVVQAVINGDSRRDISSQYNMHRENKRGYFTDEELHAVCKDLIELRSVKAVCDKWGRSNAGIRGILTRRIRPDITCQYDFESVYPKLNYVHPCSSTTIERVA